jgi:hypothetical protein
MNEQQPPESQPTPPETQAPVPQTPAPQTPAPQTPVPPTPEPPRQAVATRTYPQPHSAPQPAPKGPDPDFIPMEESSFSHILNSLLKKPLSVIYEISEGNKSPQTALLTITLVSLAVFGIVLGMFSSGNQLWAAPVKVIGGIFFSGLICLPSLYIFGALGGMDAKVQHIAGLMLTFLAITSLLLVGFAPVVWLFSTSSNSIVFFGFLSLTIWILCLIFGLRVVARASQSMGGGKGGHLKIWAIIFMLVTLQMTTTLRPIIGESESFINLEEKRFFLRYWSEVMMDEGTTKSKGKR